MSRLDEFLRLLCGRFDNTRQLEELRRSGSPALPLAEHVNTCLLYTSRCAADSNDQKG